MEEEEDMEKWSSHRAGREAGEPSASSCRKREWVHRSVQGAMNSGRSKSKPVKSASDVDINEKLIK